jgi:hypothetical protein
MVLTAPPCLFPRDRNGWFSTRSLLRASDPMVGFARNWPKNLKQVLIIVTAEADGKQNYIGMVLRLPPLKRSKIARRFDL